MYDDSLYEDEYLADLAFEELPVDGRKMVLDSVLADLKPGRRTYLLTNPDMLGVEAEAHLISLLSPEDLHRYLQPEVLERLASLVNETLLARRPAANFVQV
jgi:hypothetical protein